MSSLSAPEFDGIRETDSQKSTPLQIRAVKLRDEDQNVINIVFIE